MVKRDSKSPTSRHIPLPCSSSLNHSSLTYSDRKTQQTGKYWKLFLSILVYGVSEVCSFFGSQGSDEGHLLGSLQCSRSASAEDWSCQPIGNVIYDYIVNAVGRAEGKLLQIYEIFLRFFRFPIAWFWHIRCEVCSSNPVSPEACMSFRSASEKSFPPAPFLLCTPRRCWWEDEELVNSSVCTCFTDGFLLWADISTRPAGQLFLWHLPGSYWAAAGSVTCNGCLWIFCFLPATE